jgi:hypothetical protein
MARQDRTADIKAHYQAVLASEEYARMFHPGADEPKKRRKRIVVIPDNITPITMLRLAIAARVAFPDGSMSVGALRREGKAGRLKIYEIARKHFTTLFDIQQMRERCNIVAGDEAARARNSICATPSDPVACGDGSSSTDHHPASASSEALAHLRVIAQKLKKPLPNTSPKNTSQVSAVVIPLKS